MRQLKRAPKTLKIEVTDQDISEGVPTDSWQCPIARAIRRIYGDHPSVGTKDLHIAFGSIGKKTTYFLPTKAIKFVAAFDSDEVVGSFKFTATRAD